MSSSKSTTRSSAASSRTRSETGRASRAPKSGSGCKRKQRSNSKCRSSQIAWATQPKNSETLLRQLSFLQGLLVSMLHQQGLPPLERDTRLLSILVPIPALSSELRLVRALALTRRRVARYKQTTKGVATRRRHDATAKGRATYARYQRSPKGKLKHWNYAQSPKGRETDRRNEAIRRQRHPLRNRK